jgi:superfamily I DNA and/or RNA helicase
MRNESGTSPIGSVDKFQGQEAPIVFVSMCASDASESPRGLSFLFSKNRLNVAISRAQSLAIIVGSPRLATTSVSNLHQMELVNFYSEIILN